MLTTIRCHECGKSEGLCFSLTWTHKDEFCGECRQSKSEQQHYHFCSNKCLKKFVNKFAGHKHKYKPVHDLFTEEVGQPIIVCCTVCGITKIKMTTKADVKYMKEQCK